MMVIVIIIVVWLVDETYVKGVVLEIGIGGYVEGLGGEVLLDLEVEGLGEGGGVHCVSYK